MAPFDGNFTDLKNRQELSLKIQLTCDPFREGFALPFCDFLGLLISITTVPVAFLSSVATLSLVAPDRSTPFAPMISSPCMSVPSIAASDPGTIPKIIVPLGPFSILRPRPCPGI